MDVDIGNALSSVATPGVSRATLERLDERVATAHERIERGREENEFGYAALALPERTDPGHIRSTVEPVGDVETVLTVGIGGSALGASTLVDACSPSAGHVALDNVDPDWVERHLGALSLEETAVHVVSRSGTTAETLATFLVVREAFESAGVDWTDRTVVTTGESGPLAALADRHELARLSVPSGVPGRFAALSPVGLVAPALCGVDIEAVLEGARAELESLDGSLFESPAYAYGAVAHALEVRGATENVVLPYAERLETFAEWTAQLWAESLGKDGVGQTPVRALGATDQHSQLQLYRAGRPGRLVSFVRPRKRHALSIPAVEEESLAYLGGSTMGELLAAEFAATEASLAAAGRPSVRIEIERVDEHGLGGLLVGLEAATILSAELHGIDAFDQPAVEWGKRAARGLLGGGNVEEADAVAEKTELRVER